MKLKILQIAAIDMTIYKFVLPLMKELRNNDFEVICACRNLGAIQKIQDEGFECYDIDIERSINPVSSIKAIIQLYKIIKEEKVDIVHVHTPIASVLGRIVAKMTGVKHIVYTVHGFYISNKLFYYIEKIMAKYFTDFIFTVNKEDMEFAIKNNFIISNKIKNINSVGIDTTKFDPSNIKVQEQNKLKKSLNISQDDKVVGFIGRIVREKGIMDLIHAFARVSKKIPDTKLLIVGSNDLGERDNNTKAEIDKLIERYELNEKVIFTGFRQDIPELLSIMEIFVLPSYREGMPVSLLEAMAMELPVIGTDIRGIREEIVHEECGLIYPPEDIDSLTKYLERMLSDLDSTKLMGKKARQRVINHFSQEEVLKRQIKIFKELHL